MKKLILLSLCLLGAVGSTRSQTITLTITAGLLEQSNGTTPVPNGALLQLIASPSGTFASPTAGSYVSGDNSVILSFAMNSNGGTAGFFNNEFDSIPLTTSNYSLTANEPLELRFYPTLTFASMPTGVASGTSFGQVRSNTTEFGGADPSETAWVVPAAGASASLEYVTMSAGGTYSNSSAFAVPEPSTYGTFGGLLMGLMSVRAWKRRNAV